MGEKIQFPKNYDRFILLGQEALDQENFSLAAENFEKAYQFKQDFSLNFILVTALMELGQYQKARQLAEEQLDEYYKVSDLLIVYITLLIYTQDFIKAHEIVNDQIDHMLEPQVQRWVLMKEQIERAEAHYVTTAKKKINEILAKAGHLKDFLLKDQLIYAGEIHLLPTEEFVLISKKIIKSCNMHSLIKASVLEELAKLKVKEAVDYCWIDQQVYQVFPMELENITEPASYQQLADFIEKKTMDDDPILYQALMTEIRLHFALLYPFADREVKDPKLWALSYLLDYSENFTDSFSTSFDRKAELKKVRQKQRKLKKIIDEVNF